MYQIDWEHPINVFFCGIGGISMSGLAEILAGRGFTVSGSDRSESSVTKSLQEKGIRIIIGQRAENITNDLDLVIFTAAIHPDNPEYQQTQKLNIPFLTRAQLLGEIMRGYRCPIAVAGTHGKTTTTAMISEILLQEGCDPTVSVGGILNSIQSNVRVGSSSYFVAEACEYTNSFLSMYPKIGVILNIEADHLDFFKDLEDIRHSFRKFAERIPENGALIINSDIPRMEEITKGLPCQIITYGKNPEKSDYSASDIQYDEFDRASYTCLRKGESLKKQKQSISVGIPGEHNLYNSLAAIAVSDLLCISRDTIALALSHFQGTKRRFEVKGSKNGITVIDDYAHHPAQIEATLKAASKIPHNRIFCIFQPHTYSRTKAFFDEFAKALCLADVVILADIYAARETDTLGVSSQLLAEKIRSLGHEDTWYFSSFAEIEKFIWKNCRKGDVVITMGAGNVTEIGDALVS